MDQQVSTNAPPRKRPSRVWYLIAAIVLLVSVAVFGLTLREKFSYLNEQLGAMPRLVGPTDEAGVLVELAEPGKYNIYYENKGSFEGKTYDTPRRQVWPTFASPAMTCTVADAQTGQAIEVRLPGQDEADKKSKTSKDQIVPYNLSGMQGHSAWIFDAPKAGQYRIALAYDDAVHLEPGSVTIPPELTKAQKKEMLSADGLAYEVSRREALERGVLAELEPIDVLFAVGPDLTQGSFFAVFGLKGAAGVLAFGFTFAVLTALVTLMLRGGHVTPRGELDKAKPFFQNTTR